MLMEERFAAAPAGGAKPAAGAPAPVAVTFLNEEDLEEEEEIEEVQAVVAPKPVVPAAPAPPKPTPIEIRPAPSVKAPSAPPAGVIPPTAVGGAPIMRPSSPNMELVDMDEDSSDEETEEIAVDKRPMAPRVAAPPPINPDKVVIKHNYDPKAAAPSMVPGGGAPGTDEQMLISPLTGERVPASKMAEHMRIGLLDPKWVEQKVRPLTPLLTAWLT